MYSSQDKFVMQSITRAEIADQANRTAYEKGLKILPFTTDDMRLTDDICQALASELPLDFGDPAAEWKTDQAYLEMMQKVKALTPEQIEECGLSELAPTPSVTLSTQQD